MKILAVCAHGLGSCFLMEMNIKKALEKLVISAEVAHADFSLSSEGDADVFVMGEDIVGSRNIDRTFHAAKIHLFNRTSHPLYGVYDCRYPKSFRA